MIEVSIHCLTYNHEKYVRKTFEGFLKQKTNFAFEVLVHDDASTDGTPEIIREYTEKYPDIFKPIYQKENQYSKGIMVAYAYNFPRAVGKYMAYCEGDDYWCDENKLQKQYDIMEKHPECSICTHIAQIISAEEEKALGTIPQKPFTNGVVDEEVFLRSELIEGWASQTSSFFLRNKYLKEYIAENPKYCRMMVVGDFPTILYMLTKGKVYFIDEIMSCYRYGGASSFRENRKRDTFLEIRHLFSLVDGVNEYNKYTGEKYEQIIRTYMLMKMEQINIIGKKLIKTYEPYYLNEVYKGRKGSIRMRISYYLRKNFMPIYRFLLKVYMMIKGMR